MKKLVFILLTIFVAFGAYCQVNYKLPYDTVTVKKTNGVGYLNASKGLFTDSVWITTMGVNDSSIRAASTQFVKRALANFSGGGSTNTNVGTGFRWAIPTTNNIKTAGQGYGFLLDSATSNLINFKADTLSLATILQVQHRIDSLAATIPGATLFPTSGTGTATGPITGDLAGNDLYVTNGASFTWNANTLLSATVDGGATGYTQFRLMPSSAQLLSSNTAETVVNYLQVDQNGLNVNLTSTKTFIGGATDSANYVGESYVQKDWVTNRQNNNTALIIDSTAAQKKFLGTIYAASTFSSLTGFTSVGGATWGTSGGQITVTGGANDYSKYLSYDYFSQLENVTMNVHAVLTSLSTGIALGFGPGGNGGAVARAYLNASAGTLLVSANGTTFTSQSTLTFSAGDSVEIVLYRYVDMVTATARNLTTNSATISVSWRYDLTFGTSLLPQSTGKYVVYSMQAGQLNIKSITISSKELKRAELLILGDSKTVGAYAGAYYNTFVTQLQQNIDVVRRGGSSDRSADWVSALPELQALNPRVVLLTNPSNDLRVGVSPTVTHANYQRINDSLIADGVTVLHCQAFYETAQDNSAWNTYLSSTFPAASIVPMYDVLQATGALSADGIHPTAYGDSLIYKRLVSCGFILKARSKPIQGTPNLVSPTDYTIILKGNAYDSLSMLKFGGETANQPMLKTNGVELDVMRANNTGLFGDMKMRDLRATGALQAQGALTNGSGAGLLLQYNAAGYIDAFSYPSTYTPLNLRASTITLLGGGVSAGITVTNASKVGIATITSPTAYLHLQPSLTAGASLRIPNGVAPTSPNEGDMWQTTPQLLFRNGDGITQELQQVQQSRVSTQFDKTNTTLANVTGLTANVAAGKTYRFEAILYTTSDVGGGVKVAIGGTATATAIIYEGLTTDAGLTTQSRTTTLGNAVGAVTAVTNAYIRVTGTITVNAAGTLTAQFAENTAVNTSSVLVGSTFVVNQIL